MKKQVNPIDAIFDPNNEDNIVLYNENDEPMEFIQIAVIPIEERTFVILKPAIPMKGIADDEAITFEIKQNDEGHDTLEIVLDEDLIDKVFEIYADLVNKNS